MREAPKDRISNLPDSILHHILSFFDILEIQDGARTSVLSKRWNNIWTTVPALCFSSLFYNSVPTCYETDRFMDFVDGTLHRHNSSNIDKFALLCDHHLNESRVHSWVSTVIRGNVKELSLVLRQDHPLFIPLSLFTCVSLISLELETQPNIRLPKCISFPRLKCLELNLFKFTDECWNEELFSNSPILEELILDHCSVSMKFFCISIPSLKLLKIDNWTVDGNGLGDCVLKINTPRLVTFSYTNYVAKEFVLSSFPALVDAAVDFNFEEYGGAEISRLLRTLTHVKYLSVCNQTLQVICSAYLSNTLLTFHNVKWLMISDVLNTDQGLIGLLKAVPNLESLVFNEFMLDEQEEEEEEEEEEDNVGVVGDGDDNNENDDCDSVEGENNHINRENVSDAAECDNNDHGEDNYDNEDDSWALDIVTTGCLFPHLKSVFFRGFTGNPREIRWVKLILRNAKALQMMTIRYRNCDLLFANVKSKKELTVEIPRFPRASPGCVVKVCS